MDLAIAPRPGDNILTASLVPGMMALTCAVGLTVRLWRAGRREKLSTRRPLAIGDHRASRLPDLDGRHRQQQPVAQSDTATLVFIFSGVGIARAWELPGLRRGGLLDQPTTRGSEARQRR
jgi:hypothetical protein